MFSDSPGGRENIRSLLCDDRNGKSATRVCLHQPPALAGRFFSHQKSGEKTEDFRELDQGKNCAGGSTLVVPPAHRILRETSSRKSVIPKGQTDTHSLRAESARHARMFRETSDRIRRKNRSRQLPRSHPWRQWFPCAIRD